MTQFTRHHSHHCHLHNFRPVPRVPPVDHPLSCYYVTNTNIFYTPSMNIRPYTSICWPHIHMKATGKHGGIYQMWIPVSCQEQEVLSSNWCRVHQYHHFLYFPHPWPSSGAGIVGLASRLRLHIADWFSNACLFKVSSHGGSWPDSMNPFLACQRLKRRSFMSVSGVVDAHNLQVKACSVFGMPELKFHSQPIWQKASVNTSFCWMSLRPLTFPLQRMHLSCHTR